MGAPKTKIVGGGSATNVGNQFSSWLGGMLNPGAQNVPGQAAQQPMSVGQNLAQKAMQHWQNNQPVKPNNQLNSAGMNFDPNAGGGLGVGANPSMNPAQGGDAFSHLGRSDYGNGMNAIQYQNQGMNPAQGNPMGGDMSQFIMNGGSAAPPPRPGSPNYMMGGQGGGMNPATGGGYQMGPQQQQQGGFQGAVDNMLNPNIQNMISQNPFLAGMQNHNPMANLNGMQPNWQHTQMTAPGQQFNQNVNAPQAQAGQSDVNGFMNQHGGNTQNILSMLGINPGQAMGGLGGLQGLNQASSDFNYNAGSLVDPTKDPSYQAIQDIAGRTNAQDIANLRERFGTGAMSSGASLAEGQYRAEANPRLIQSLGTLGRDIRGQDLAQQQTNNQLRLGLQGNQVQDALGRYGIQTNRDIAGLNQAGQNMSSLLGFAGNIQGQNLGAASQLTGQNANLQTQTNLGNAGNQLAANQSNASNNLQAQQNNAQNQMGMNNLNLQQGMGQNTFNQNNFQQNSSNALQNQQMANQFQQFLGQSGINLQQLAQSGQQGMIGQLMQAFMGAQQIGTPQAQAVQQQNPWMQLAGQGLGLAGSYFGAK
jgi:hypothetical protein